MPYKEKHIEKKYYSIGEVAEIFDVSTSLIRFWETEFDIIQPRKNQKGNRQFTKGDMDNIRLVYHLVKEKGYTLSGAKDMIKNKRLKVENNLQAIDSLKKVRHFLNDLRDQLS